jgi:hypothetical protein
MKANWLVLILVLGMLSCSQEKKAEDGKTTATAEKEAVVPPRVPLIAAAYHYYGDTIDVTKAKSMDSLESEVKAKGEVNAKVYGYVDNTCQSKGCWMTVKMPDGTKTMQVKTKDHAFFLPIADFKNKQVVFEGTAYYDTTAVEDLKHYAEDAKKSEAEIAKITEPKIEMVFIASGIAIEKDKDDDINKQP